MGMTTIPFVFPGIPRVRCAFQTRGGGHSAGEYAGGNISYAVGDNPVHVRANLDDLRVTLGLDVLCDVHQVHGVVTVIEPQPATPVSLDEPTLEADGMATARKRFGLLVKSADCQPILLAHESGRFVAGIHAGWQGNRQDYPGVAVKELCAAYGVKAEELSAVRGPSLGPAKSEFVNFADEWGHEFAQWYEEREKIVNLWRLAKDQLLAAGLREDRIYSLDLCTASLDIFYSYRRDKVTGRQGSIIWIE